VVSLKSASCQKFLSIKDDEVEAVDSLEDEDTRFIVHVKRPGVVALQSKSHTDNWIGIINGDITGAVRVCVCACACACV